MKKLIIASALLFNVLIFSSCQKELVQVDEHSRMKEVLYAKKWKLVSSEIVLPAGNKPKDIDSCRLDNIWEYRKDGTFALYVGEEHCSEDEKTMYGTWDLSLDNTKINYDLVGIGSYADEVVEISNEKVVVKFTTDNVFTETYMPL